MKTKDYQRTANRDKKVERRLILNKYLTMLFLIFLGASILVVNNRWIEFFLVLLLYFSSDVLNVAYKELLHFYQYGVLIGSSVRKQMLSLRFIQGELNLIKYLGGN